MWTKGARFGAVAAGTLGLVGLVWTPSWASPLPPGNQIPAGAAYHVSGSARVVERKLVRLTVACTEGASECRGTVRLQSRARLRSTPRATLRVLTIISGSYGIIAAGQRATVDLPIRQAAQRYVLGHRRTAARISFRNEATSEPLQLSDRVTVENSDPR